MTVKDDPIMEEAASHLHKLTEEERIRYQCEARERWLLFERSKRESRKSWKKNSLMRTNRSLQKTSKSKP